MCSEECCTDKNYERETVNMREKAKRIKANIPAVFLALKDTRTPFPAKLLAAVTIGYALSPIDLIPDFIPVLGYLDDVILLPALIALTMKLIPEEVWEECKEKSENFWKDGKPKKWYFAIPIVVFWALIIWLVVKAIWF